MQTQPTLYLASQDMQNRIALCVDEETGELDMERLNAIEASFHDRAVAYVAVFKSLGHTVASLKAVRAEYDALIARHEANAERLKTSLMEAMRYTGTHSVTDGVLSATLFPDRDESVELDPDATFPGSLGNDPKPPTPSKTLIKKAILAGEPVAGARLVKRDRLTIR